MMNIMHDKLTWPAGLQQQVQEDHQAKSRAAQRGDGGKARPLETRAVMLGRLEKIHDTKYMTPLSTHRDGGLFCTSLKSLAAQGVCLRVSVSKWERFMLSCKSNSSLVQIPVCLFGIQHVYIYVYVYIYMCIYIFTYIYIYTYM